MTMLSLKKKEKPKSKVEWIERLTERDWRGILALVVIVGGFVLLAIAMFLDRPWVASGLLPIIALVTQWYFKQRDEAGSIRRVPA